MGSSLPPYTPPPTRRVVGTRAGIMGGVATKSDGTVAGATYRNWHQASSACAVSDLVVSFANWMWEGSTLPSELIGDNVITVKAAIEYNGVSYPLYFRGARTGSIDPGGTLQSDVCGVQVPAGASFWTRVYVTANGVSSGTWPRGRAMYTTQEGNNYTATPADVVDATGQITSGTLTSGNFYMFNPLAITGLPAIVAPAIGFTGDSIGQGSGEGSSSAAAMGFLERGVGTSASWQSMTRATHRATYLVASPGRALASNAGMLTSLINELGINDIFGGLNTLAQIQATEIALWTLYANRGVKVFQTTFGPNTTSTDSWATTANQTKTSSAQDAVRVNFNNWLRAGAPMAAGVAVAIGTAGALLMGQGGHPLSGYLEIADIFESSRDSGLWQVNGAANYPTTDGLHPTTALHILAAVPVSSAIAAGIIR